MFKAKIIASMVFCAVLSGEALQPAWADKPFNKADWKKPDLSGTVTEISADGKQITLQTSKGGKNQPPQTAIAKLADSTQVTFSAVAPLGDKPAAGYTAQVWLDAGSPDRAAQINYQGNESFKSINRQADVAGKVTHISADGSRFSIETAGVGKGSDAVTNDVRLTPASSVFFSAVTTGGAKLQEGYEAQVWLDENARENAAIVRLSGHEAAAKKGNDGKNVDASGRIVAVSADGKTITLETKATVKNQPAPRSDVKLADSTRLIYSGVGPDGAKPAEGYQAEAWLDNGVATMVRFNGWPREKEADLSSKVVAVSPDAKVITLEVQAKIKGTEPEKRDIQIDGAKILYNGVKQGELKPTVGYEARVWLEPKTPGVAARVAFSKSRE